MKIKEIKKGLSLHDFSTVKATAPLLTVYSALSYMISRSVIFYKVFDILLVFGNQLFYVIYR